MTGPEAIARLHRGMTRQGPGTPEDVRWALARLDVDARARIADAGCGPGADLVALARARPGARIEGVEMMDHLVAEARAACAGLENVTVRQGDMADLGTTGPHDLIWCAGALYFLGVTEGLRQWRAALAPGGAVAFSEPVLEEDAPGAARAFWAEYPAISDLAGIEERVRAADFAVLDHRRVAGAAWAVYYRELEARLDALSADPEAAGEGPLADLVAATRREIALWQAVPEAVSYALVLVRPEPGGR